MPRKRDANVRVGMMRHVANVCGRSGAILSTQFLGYACRLDDYLDLLPAGRLYHW
jgi:hypothetical protein